VILIYRLSIQVSNPLYQCVLFVNFGVNFCYIYSLKDFEILLCTCFASCISFLLSIQG
jgi:hypothetical protein